MASRTFSLFVIPRCTCSKGPWESDEQSRLIHTIEELARAGKSDVSAAGFWVLVSKAMGATRTPKQCQSKWCVLFSLICKLSRYAVMHYAGRRPSKGKLETKIRCSVGQKTIAMSSFASGYCCIVNFVTANHLIPHRIASLDLDDERDIDWKSLGDPSWDKWNAHVLRQKWRQLKTSYNADGAHRGQCMILSCFSLSTSRT